MYASKTDRAVINISLLYTGSGTTKIKLVIASKSNSHFKRLWVRYKDEIRNNAETDPWAKVCTMPLTLTKGKVSKDYRKALFVLPYSIRDSVSY